MESGIKYQQQAGVNGFIPSRILSMGHDKYGDYIESLRTNNIQPSEDEVKIVKGIFDNNLLTESVKDMHNNGLLLTGFIFLVLSSKYADTVIGKLLEKTFPKIPNNYIIVLVIKTILFIIVMWFMRNIKFLKK